MMMICPRASDIQYFWMQGFTLIRTKLQQGKTTIELPTASPACERSNGHFRAPVCEATGDRAKPRALTDLLLTLRLVRVPRSSFSSCTTRSLSRRATSRDLRLSESPPDEVVGADEPIAAGRGGGRGVTGGHRLHTGIEASAAGYRYSCASLPPETQDLCTIQTRHFPPWF